MIPIFFVSSHLMFACARVTGIGLSRQSHAVVMNRYDKKNNGNK